MKWLGVITVLTLVSAGMVVLTPWPLKILIDHALGDAPLDGWPLSLLSGLSASHLILVAAGAALVITLLGTVVENMLLWSWSIAGQRMVHRFASDILSAMQRLSLRFHARANIGDLLNRVAGDTYCVYRIVESLLISPMLYILTLVLIIIVAWGLSPVLTFSLLAIIPPLVLLAFIVGPRLKRASRSQRDARSALSGFVHQALSAVPVLQMYNAQPRYARQFDDHAGQVIKTSNFGVWQDHVYRLINGTATTAAIALVVYVGGTQVLEGSLTIGSLVIFLMYARNISGVINKVFISYGNLSKAGAQVERVLEVLDSDEVVPDPAVPCPLPPATGGGAEVVFRGVDFGYEPGVPVLKGIDLTIHAGSSVALVGPTGAGKTTLASLILRFFDPGEGAVLFNGVDVREVSLKELRSRVSIILQQPFILPITVGQNIAYGFDGATQEQIIEAAKRANCHGFISKLPAGYETVLSEGGADLSGGERQRIAIARAFLADAELLILDEPTSALDGSSELVVLDALERLRLTRTTLIIAHRLSTTQHCDRIVAMEDGRVVESGTHGELIACEGLYARLFSTQSEMTGGSR